MSVWISKRIEDVETQLARVAERMTDIQKRTDKLKKVGNAAAEQNFMDAAAKDLTEEAELLAEDHKFYSEQKRKLTARLRIEAILSGELDVEMNGNGHSNGNANGTSSGSQMGTPVLAPPGSLAGSFRT